MAKQLDPASARGTALADQLGNWLARVELAIEEREARTAALTQQEASTAA